MAATAAAQASVFPTGNGTWQQVTTSSGGGAQIRQDTGLEWVTPHTQQLGHTTPAITRAFYISKPAIAADVAHVLQEPLRPIRER